MIESIDPSPYVRQPVLNVANGVALPRALLTAVPSNAPPGVRNAARRLRREAETLQAAWVARGRFLKAADARPADQAMDIAVAALESRLASYGTLAAAEYPKADRARELVARLFPQGLGFLRLPYAEEWAEVGKLLAAIDGEGLAADLDRVCGKEFLATVRVRFEEYGRAIGITEAGTAAPDADLVEPLRAVGRAIVSYAVQLLGYADESGDIDGVRRALAPIDRHRDATNGRRARPTPETAPEPASAEAEALDAPLPPAP